jgi:hypothetical protein
LNVERCSVRIRVPPFDISRRATSRRSRRSITRIVIRDSQRSFAAETKALSGSLAIARHHEFAERIPAAAMAAMRYYAFLCDCSSRECTPHGVRVLYRAPLPPPPSLPPSRLSPCRAKVRDLIYIGPGEPCVSYGYIRCT